MTAPRIVHVVRSLDPWGTQRQLVAVAQASQRRGLSTIVLSIRDGACADPLRAAGAEACIVGGGDRPSFAAAVRMARAVYAARPNLVQLWDDWSLRHVGPAAVLRRRQVPYLGAVRNPPPLLTWARRRLEQFVLRGAAAIVSPSAVLREQCLSAYDAAGLADAWRVVDDAVDVSSPNMDRAAVLANLGLPATARLIGVASQLIAEKNLRDVLFAAALLRMAHDDLRLVVCGDGPHASVVRRFCTAMRIDDITRFTGIRTDVTEILRHCEVCIDAASDDGPSRTITEARRLGVPVVCVDSPIRREQVRAEVDALLYPAHDPGALTRQVHQLLVDSAMRDRLAAAAREHAARRSPAETAAGAYVDLYESVAKSS